MDILENTDSAALTLLGAFIDVTVRKMRSRRLIQQENPKEE